MGSENVMIRVPPYTAEEGIGLEWDDDFCILCDVDAAGVVVIQANPSGLRSLARHLLTLAQNNVPDGAHVHLDEFSALEDGSREVVLARRTEF